MRWPPACQQQVCETPQASSLPHVGSRHETQHFHSANVLSQLFQRADATSRAPRGFVPTGGQNRRRVSKCPRSDALRGNCRRGDFDVPHRFVRFCLLRSSRGAPSKLQYSVFLRALSRGKLVTSWLARPRGPAKPAELTSQTARKFGEWCGNQLKNRRDPVGIGASAGSVRGMPARQAGCFPGEAETRWPTTTGVCRARSPLCALRHVRHRPP